MSEDAALSWFVAAWCAVSFAAAWLMTKRRARWSSRKVTLLAALPIPSIAAACCVWIFGRAAYDQAVTPEICGVDACAMAMAGGMILLFWAAAAFVLAWVAATLAVRLAR